MFKTTNIKLLYGICGLFIAINILLLNQGFYWLAVLPAAILIGYMFFFSLDKLLFLLIIITPFAVNYEHPEMGFSVNLPTEPVIVAIMLLFFLELIYEQNYYEKNIVKHPVTIAIIAHLTWMLVTSFTSEIKWISFKYFISQLWFIITFYFLIIKLFKEKENLHKFIWCYGIPLALVIIYITIQHSTHNFDRQIGTQIVKPFFNDHTQYSAVISLIAPIFLIIGFNKRYPVARRNIALIMFLIFITGIIFSYSRASWMGIIVAFAGFWVIFFKINYRFIFSTVILIFGFLYMFQTDIVIYLERDQQESSGDFREHLQSVYNITSDASNMERINRWKSAYRMFEERPVFGWGPGTYYKVYAPFQRSEDYTVITTHFGDVGNAHSEYIGPLSESGLPGMLTFIAIVITVLYTGIRNFYNNRNTELRWISIGATLGLITYFTHGVLNNFLDTNKASVLFWSLIAIIVAIDLFHNYNYEHIEPENK